MTTHHHHHTRPRSSFTTLSRALLLPACLFLAALPSATRAATTIDIFPSGNDVVTLGYGTVNTTALTNSGPVGGSVGIRPNLAVIYVGDAIHTQFSGISGPSNFGSAAGTLATSWSGQAMGRNGSRNLIVPQGYVSGSALSATATYANSTLASLGLAPGQYVYTWGSGGTADSMTINILVNSPLVVTTSSDVVNNADNLTSLREAIAYANSHPGADTITFGDGSGSGGTNFLDATADIITLAAGELSLTDTTGATTIQGTGADRLTIDGNNASRILLVNGNVTAEVSDLTLARGNAFGGGGGALNDGGTLTVRRAVVRDCVATFADGGGGIASQSNSGQPSTLRVIDSTVSGNTARHGGGIAADWNGAAAVLEIVQSTVVGNTALNVFGGGGVFAGPNTTNTVTQTTIAGNSNTAGPGGGISAVGGNYTFTIRNSLVAGNTAASGPDVSATGTGTFTDGGGNLLSVPGGFTLGQVLQVDGTGKPLLANNGGPTPTVALVAGSPAINAGAAVALTTDQRGQPRSFGLGVDIGAFEVQALFPQITLAPASQSVAFGGTATFTALASELFAGTAPDSLTDGAALLPGQFLLSPNRAYQLIYQTDGNLVLYRGDGVPLWASGTSGQSAGRAVMQTDGNFVIYDAGNVPRFATQTFANSHAVMRLQDDGNLLIYSAVATPIYASGTSASGPISSPTPQWQVSTDGGSTFNDIPGATGLTLTIPNLTLADNQKQYRVKFSNPAGTAPSAAATLTVLLETRSLVVTTASDTGTLSDNLTSLREAIAYAASLGGNQTITFGNGLATGGTNFTDGTADTISLTQGELVVDGVNLTIVGSGADRLILDGLNAYRIFKLGTVTPAINVSISGMTLTKGLNAGFNSVQPSSTQAGDGRGGAIFNASTGSVSFTDCVISACVAQGGDGRTASGGHGGGGYGGAICNAATSGTLSLLRTTLANNACAGGAHDPTGGNTLRAVAHGGGIFNAAGGAVQLTNCVITGNTATGAGISGSATPGGFGRGAGLHNAADGTVTIIDTTFSSNSAIGGGSDSLIAGGVSGEGAALYLGGTGGSSVSGCTFAGNVATGGDTRRAGQAAGNGRGAGIASAGSGALVVSNSTFAQNSANGGLSNVPTANGLGQGGAIANLGSSPVSLVNVTVSGNAANILSSGGGLANLGAGTFALTNTIVAGNTAVSDLDVTGNFASATGNLIGKVGAATGFGAGNLVGTNATPIDPMLGALASNGGLTQTMALLAGSPSVDAGTAVTLTTDQRGQPRRIGLGVDIGAFESALVPITSTPGRYIGSRSDSLGALNYAARGFGSGYINIGGLRYSFLAKFDGTTKTVNAKRTGFTSIPVTISALTGDGVHAQLRLSYTDPLSNQLVEVDISRTAYDSSNPCPHAGNWKVAFRNSAAVGAPTVSAVANVAITSTGSVRITGSTASRRVFMRGTVMIDPASIPFYMNCILAPTQTVQGTLNFSGDSAMGDLRWVVPAGAEADFVNAIDEDYAAIGSRFTALPLAPQGGVFTLTNPGRTAGPVTGAATLQPTGMITGVPRVFALVSKGGGLSGFHIEAGVRTSFSGVYLPVNGEAIGFSRQGDNFGEVTFTPLR